jgi:beta-glucanase (GH16 family)
MKIKQVIKLFLTSVVFLVGTSFSAQASPPSGYTWNLVASDDFNSLNGSTWGYGSTGWGTEAQSSCCLIPSADTYVSGGSLVLRSRLGPFTGASGKTYKYSSGWAWTKTRRTYGYIEIRAQYPNNTGAWPAFWMLASGWPPEIDCAEFRGPPKGYMTMAYYNGSWSTTTRSGTYTSWHTYGLQWEKTFLKWYIDGTLVKTYTGTTPSVAMYVILSNGTDCSQSDASGFPNYYNVDYFRWYQHN